MLSGRNILNLRSEELVGVCQKKTEYKEKHMKEGLITLKD